MDELNSYTVCAIVIIAAIVVAVIVLVFKSPFHYPYFIHYFDVSGKRKPQIDDLIDEFINLANFHKIQKHNNYIFLWKQECQKKIEKSKIKNYRKSSLPLV